MSQFASLELLGWRQFDRIALDLTRQTTVLTGANGTGKTTILNVLGHHFGWRLPLVATPYLGKRTAKRIWSDIYAETILDPDQEIPNDRVQIGTIGYSDGAKCQIISNRFTPANYTLEYRNLKAVTGLLIPSHRPVATYHAVNEIPTNPVTAQQHYQEYQNLLFKAFGATPRTNPGLIQKKSIISLALFGEGNSAVAPNYEYARTFRDFQGVLAKVLPSELGFRRLEIRMPEVVLVTQSGDFSLDAMSGGINAIFGIAWQIFMFGFEGTNVTVAIDEPENHLHPSMQRALLPNLARAFPNTRFIVSTHSPFIVTSFPEAKVYGLNYNASQRVVEARDLAGTPNTVLREVLDVDSNLPMWVQEKIQAVLEKYDSAEPRERAERVTQALRELGIGGSIAEYRHRNK